MKNIESKLGLKRDRDGQLKIAKEGEHDRKTEAVNASGNCSIDANLGKCGREENETKKEKGNGKGGEGNRKREFNKCTKIDLAKLKMDEEGQKRKTRREQSPKAEKAEAELTNLVGEINTESKDEM